MKKENKSKSFTYFFLFIMLMSQNAFSYSFRFHFATFFKQKVRNYGTYRAYDNNTYAKSCDDYRNPNTNNRLYTGDTGDGIYRINPDNGTPFDAYCDMTTDSTGWTLIYTGNMTANYINTPASIYNGTSTENYSFTILTSVTMNQAQLMNVINRVPFTQIKLPLGYILSSTNTTSTFAQKYNAQTSWTSATCNTPYGQSIGWNAGNSGYYTYESTVLGCSTTAGTPDSNPAHIDWAFTGIGVYATSNPACVDQGGYYASCGARYLVGYVAHRQSQSFNVAAAVASKSNLVWIK